MTEPPVESPYLSVVSLQSLRMMMFIDELNGYEMCAGNIGNAHLESICDEKVAFVAGPEFGAIAGHLMIIKKALYGLRTSGSGFYRLLASVLHNLAFFPSKADRDIWMHDCKTHWEYVATYVDDLLYVGKNSKHFFQSLLDVGFKLKGVGMPKYHLGGDFKRVDVPKKILTWGSYTSVNKMLKKYEQLFDELVPKFDDHAPLEPGDHPKLDDSPLCDANQTHMFMSMIGNMQWAVSLGRIDIFCATMFLSTFHAMPCIGHLERAKRFISS
jgi:Reverse transcriptase (RNA-dependent DNA polymerase)